MSDFERLYLLPGVSHCGRGEGAGLLIPMMSWVKDGAAPDADMTASTGEASGVGPPDGVDADKGGPLLPNIVRPVCLFPHVAIWPGKGAVMQAAGWIEGPAAEVVSWRDWPGADLFARYAFID